MASKTCNRYDLILIRFLDILEEEIPVAAGQQIAAVSANLATRGTEEAQHRLTDHPAVALSVHPDACVIA